jgi:hypothetical protein
MAQAQPVIPLTTGSVAITVNTATTTLLVAGVAGQRIYVTAWSIIAAGTGNVSLVYGTTVTNPCDTGQVALTGTYNLTAQTGLAFGNGGGIILVVPPTATPTTTAFNLCIVTSAAVGMPGSLAYARF